MADTQLMIMAHDRMMGIFVFIAREIGTSQALAALKADKKETEALLAYYLGAPRGALGRGERAFSKRNLTKRLGSFDAIEAAIKSAGADDEEEEDLPTGPVLVWTNPKLIDDNDPEF